MNGFSGSMLIGVMCHEPMMMIKKMMMVGVMCYKPNTGESGEALSGIFTT